MKFVAFSFFTIGVLVGFMLEFVCMDLIARDIAERQRLHSIEFEYKQMKAKAERDAERN